MLSEAKPSSVKNPISANLRWFSSRSTELFAVAMGEPGPPNPLTHLSEEEAVAVRALADLLQARGLLARPEYLDERDMVYGLNDDVTLLRFLRGNSMNPDAALQQFLDALAMRDSVHANKSYGDVDVDDFQEARKMYPHWSGRRDKSGLPLCVFDLAHLDSTALSGYNKHKNTKTGDDGDHAGSDARRQAIIAHDYLIRFVLPLCTKMTDRPEAEKPVTSAVYLVDVSSLSLRQGWSLKAYAQETSNLLATCYPELIDRVYVLNAPSFFGTIWGFLSRWVDPRTAAKLVIVPSADVLKTLSSTIAVENIPVQFGGHYDFHHGTAPRLDKGILGGVSWSQASDDSLPSGPIKWLRDDGGEETLLGVGTTGGVSREVILGRHRVNM